MSHNEWIRRMIRWTGHGAKTPLFCRKDVAPGIVLKGKFVQVKILTTKKQKYEIN